MAAAAPDVVPLSRCLRGNFYHGYSADVVTIFLVPQPAGTWHGEGIYMLGSIPRLVDWQNAIWEQMFSHSADSMVETFRWIVILEDDEPLVDPSQQLDFGNHEYRFMGRAKPDSLRPYRPCEGLDVVSESTWNDPWLALGLLENNSQSMCCSNVAVPESVRRNRNLMLSLVCGFASTPRHEEARFNCIFPFLYHAGDNIRSDRFVILAAVRDRVEQWNVWSPLKNVSRELGSDHEIFLAAVMQNSAALRYASPELLANREFALETIRCAREVRPLWRRSGQHRFELFSEELRGDREIVSLAVADEKTNALEYASAELRADREIVLLAVKHCAAQFRYAAPALRSDPEFVLRAIKDGIVPKSIAQCHQRRHLAIKAGTLRHFRSADPFFSTSSFWGANHEGVVDSLRSDREFMLRAIAILPFCIQYASEDLRRDKELALMAVSGKHEFDENDGYLVLEILPEEMRADPEVVVMAARKHIGSLEFAAAPLRSSAEVMRAALDPECDRWRRLLSTSFRENSLDAAKSRSRTTRRGKGRRGKGPKKWWHFRELVLAVARRWSFVSSSDLSGLSDFLDAGKMSYTLKKDREIFLAAVQRDGLGLRLANDALKADREIVLAAVQQNGHVLQHVAPAMRDDREIVLAAVSSKINVLKFVSPRLQSDREVVLTALRTGKNFHSAHEIVGFTPTLSVTGDREIAEYAIGNGISLRFNREVSVGVVGWNYWARNFHNRSANPEFEADRGVALAAVGYDSNNLQYYTSELRGDLEIVRAAARGSVDALRFASASLLADPEAVLSLVRSVGANVFDFAADELRSDRSFQSAVLRETANSI